MYLTRSGVLYVTPVRLVACLTQSGGLDARPPLFYSKSNYRVLFVLSSAYVLYSTRVLAHVELSAIDNTYESFSFRETFSSRNPRDVYTSRWKNETNKQCAVALDTWPRTSKRIYIYIHKLLFIPLVKLYSSFMYTLRTKKKIIIITQRLHLLYYPIDISGHSSSFVVGIDIIQFYRVGKCLRSLRKNRYFYKRSKYFTKGQSLTRSNTITEIVFYVSGIGFSTAVCPCEGVLMNRLQNEIHYKIVFYTQTFIKLQLYDDNEDDYRTIDRLPIYLFFSINLQQL